MQNSIRNSEIVVSAVDGLVGGVNLAKVAAEMGFEIVETGLNIGCCSLHKCLDRTIGQITHEAGQVITARRTLGGIAKTHALDSAFEDDLFGDLLHRPILEALPPGRNKKA